MGIWSRLQQEKTNLGEISFVNTHHQLMGRVNLQAVREGFDLDVLEIMRGDLAKTLYDITKEEVEYCFGDSIQAFKQDEEGVDVTFERGGSRRFDLLVGADGLHSIVRSLVFGEKRTSSTIMAIISPSSPPITIWDSTRPACRCIMSLEKWSGSAVHEATRSWSRSWCSSNPRRYAMIIMT
jgi:2-polyprenyl-6-methoxyphenol hydroxylase-like FAD-dependent oxidoreductase